MFRAARPRDIIGLIGLAGRPMTDHARPYARLGRERAPRRPVARVVGAASLPRRGVTLAFILPREGAAGALIVVRGARGGSSWELRHLLVPPDAEDVCGEILPQLDAMLRPRRRMNIFLRLAEESRIAQVVSAAGFRGYAHEELYVRPAGERMPRGASPDIEVRPLDHAADFRLFRLYTAWSPVAVRTADGLTLRAWQDSLETRWLDVRGTTDLVASVKGQPVGWARYGDTGSKTVLAHSIAAPSHPNAHEALIEAILQARGSNRTLQFLAPSSDGHAAHALTARGFHLQGAYRSFACQIGERVPEGALAPAGL